MKIRLSLFLNIIAALIILLGIAESADDVKCVLNISPGTEKCRITLFVKNETEQTLKLSFSSSNINDFIALNKDGEEVWKWSEGRIFMPVVTDIKLGPNEEYEYKGEWNYTGKDGKKVLPGQYIIYGILNTSPAVYTKKVMVEVKKINTSIKGRVTQIMDKYYLLGDDGIPYHIENPSKKILDQREKRIETNKYKITPIPGTIDKKIEIKNFKCI